MSSNRRNIKSADVELLLNEIQDTKNELSRINTHLVEVQTTLKVFIEQHVEMKKAVAELDKEVHDKISPLINQQNIWKGALTAIAALSILVPVLIVGTFVLFNPNNSRLEELEDKFTHHIYDPQLHHNIINYVDTNFVKKKDL